VAYINVLRERVKQHDLNRTAIDRMLWQAMLACANHTISPEGDDCSLTIALVVDKAAGLVLAHLDNSPVS